MLPLAFLSPGLKVNSVLVMNDESRLIQYLKEVASAAANDSSVYEVAVNVEVHLKRSKLDSAVKVQVTNDPNATRATPDAIIALRRTERFGEFATSRLRRVTGQIVVALTAIS